MSMWKAKLLRWLADRWLPDNIGVIRTHNPYVGCQVTTYCELDDRGVAQGRLVSEVTQRGRTTDQHDWTM